MNASTATTAVVSPLDVARLRHDFPALQQQVHGRPLVFLDSAASAQKPEAVLAAMEAVYRTTYANVHRGAYQFSRRSTDLYEAARARVAAFLHAATPNEIVFTRGATEALNLVAQSYARAHLRPGDEIVVSELEHHANYLPWLMLAQEGGLHLRRMPLAADGVLDLHDLDALITPRTRLVSVAHVSNVLGSITDVPAISARAHAVGAVVVLDACQSAPHLPLDVQTLGCDFLALSGHKAYAPTGIGVLWGRAELLERMPPRVFGGDMARAVTFEGAEWQAPPLRFEAGTPPFVEAIGLAAALDYLQTIGMEAIRAHEKALLAYALKQLHTVPGLTLLGPVDAEQRSGAIAFTVEGLAPQSLAVALDGLGVAIRAGRHCAHPLHQRLGLAASARASLGLYNDRNDIDALVHAIQTVLCTPTAFLQSLDQGCVER
jgi:cysteine desulfurase / selenocysteine lyase